MRMKYHASLGGHVVSGPGEWVAAQAWQRFWMKPMGATTVPIRRQANRFFMPLLEVLYYPILVEKVVTNSSSSSGRSRWW